MAKGKVLIVEDDRALADVLSYNLKQAGYDVLVASDGQDGITQAQLKSPDVVLLDLMLPVVDGLDVCRRLRSDAPTRDLLIIMLTAKNAVVGIVSTGQIFNFCCMSHIYWSNI